MTNEIKPKQEIITENIRVFPNGRGRVLVIAEKRILKQKKTKNKDRFSHFRLNSNPQPISIVEFNDNDKPKRIVIFPEGKILQHEDRLDLVASLLVTLPKAYTCEQHGKESGFYPSFYSRELQVLTRKKWERYQRWLRKQQ